MADLFDMRLRGFRRDRAARIGPELFLLERVFGDCLERIEIMSRNFQSGLLIGSPDPQWPARLGSVATSVDVRDPGRIFARASGGLQIQEDAWEPQAQAYDLVLAIGTLDTVNAIPTALRVIRHAMRPEGLFIGALAGAETLPQLRAAMRAADAVTGEAKPHVHPRIEPSALAPLLADAGFVKPVVDVDRVQLSYPCLGRLVADLRAMGATNVMRSRAAPFSRQQLAAAETSFRQAGDGTRTLETVEILHFATWTPGHG